LKTLKQIQIYQNGIKEEGMSLLINSFASNKELKILKMNDNLIKNTGPILAEILPSLTKLCVLDISDSLLGHEHSLDIFKSLCKLSSIQEIYCNYNEIEKKHSQKCIFELCLAMDNLISVEIKGNDIDPSLWKKFQKQLREKIAKFEPYSDEEEDFLEEEEELIEEINKKLNLDM
jgi:Ran GTPase-activating protein (RanGAP) involved in mRNA processing and transport